MRLFLLAMLMLAACYAPTIGPHGRVIRFELRPQLTEDSEPIPADAQWSVKLQEPWLRSTQNASLTVVDCRHEDLTPQRVSVPGEFYENEQSVYSVMLTLPSGIELTWRGELSLVNEDAVTLAVDVLPLAKLTTEFVSREVDHPVGMVVMAVFLYPPGESSIWNPRFGNMAAYTECGEGRRLDFGIVPASSYKVAVEDGFYDWSDDQTGIVGTPGIKPKYERLLTLYRWDRGSSFSTRIASVIPEGERRDILGSANVQPDGVVSAWMRKAKRPIIMLGRSAFEIPARAGLHGGVVRMFGPWDDVEAEEQLSGQWLWVRALNGAERTAEEWEVYIQYWDHADDWAHALWHRVVIPEGTEVENIREGLGFTPSSSQRVRLIAIYPAGLVPGRQGGEPKFRIDAIEK